MKRHPTSSRIRLRGAAVFDIFATAFVFFICSMLVKTGIQYLSDTSETSRLHSSIQAINRAIYLFKTTGGDLSDALTPEQVISKMRAAEEDHMNLAVHSVFDAAFEPVYDSPGATRERADRAFWNAEKQVFQIIESDLPGITGFEEPD